MSRRDVLRAVVCSVALMLAGLLGAYGAAYDVQDFSWSFDNFSATSEETPCSDDLTWAQYHLTFIDVPESKTTAGLDWELYDKVYRRKLSGPGLCFGMSLLATAMVVQGGHLGFCPPVAQYSGALRASCWAPGVKEWVKLGPSDTLLRETIERVHGQQLNETFLEWVFGLILNQQKAVPWDGRIAYQVASDNAPCLLTVSKTKNTADGAHTLVAYATEQAGSKRYIYVYDPNFSYADQRYKGLYHGKHVRVEVQNNGRWVYPMTWDVQTDSTKTYGYTYTSTQTDSWGGQPASGGVLPLGGMLIATPLEKVVKRDRSIVAKGAALLGNALNLVFVSGGASLDQIEGVNGRGMYVEGTTTLDFDPTTGLGKAMPLPIFSGATADAGDTGAYLVRADGEPLRFCLEKGSGHGELLLGAGEEEIRVRLTGEAGHDVIDVSVDGAVPTVSISSTSAGRLVWVEYAHGEGTERSVITRWIAVPQGATAMVRLADDATVAAGPHP